jgi:hypothetical protein
VHPADVNPVHHYNIQDMYGVAIVDSWLSYISRAFSYWSGSIDYRIQVVATQFHSGKLIASFLPGLSSADGISLSQKVACPNLIMDLNENKEWVFSVPWNSILPWLRVAYPYWEYDPVRFSEIALGFLAISVLNPLTAPSTVAPSVEINVFISGGTDFKLKGPRNIRMFPQMCDSYYDPPYPTDLIALQGPMIGVEFTRDEVAQNEPLKLQFGQEGTVSSVPIFTGEDVMDLRSLLRRQFLVAASPVPQISPNVTTSTPDVSSFCYIYPCATADLYHAWSGWWKCTGSKFTCTSLPSGSRFTFIFFPTLCFLAWRYAFYCCIQSF